MFEKFRQHPALPYLLIVLICVLAYGLLAPTLGFYWDDWPVIYLAETQGTKAYWDFYQFDRPFSAWTYVLTVPLLGTSPLPWHLFVLGLRILTVVAFYWALTALWPPCRRRALWAALLFAVYPSFWSQPIAVAYSQHFITYALFMLSFAAMLWAYRSPRHAIWLTVVALLAQAFHLVTVEYFVGLEILRPLALWLVIRKQEHGTQREAIKEAILRALPYLAVLIAFVLWRAYLVEVPDDPNTLVLLRNLLQTPLATAIAFLQQALRNLLYLLVTIWYETFDPELIDFEDRFLLTTGALVLFVTLIFSTLLGGGRERKESTDEGDSWSRQAMLAGVVMLLLGYLPAWVTGRDPLQGFFSDRFTLAAMPGAAMLIVGLIESLGAKLRVRAVMLAFILALAVGFHVRNTNEFRNEWIDQLRVYDQLISRAPGIDPGTAIVFDGTFSTRVTDYSAALAFNTLYPQSAFSGPDYWIFHFSRHVERRTEDIPDGVPLSDELRNIAFEGNTRQALLFYNNVRGGACLWLLTPLDAANEELPDDVRMLANYIDLSRLYPEVELDFPENIFTIPLERYWCQIYQEAALAAQLRDWQRVIALHEEALVAGYDPNRGVEYAPFIKAYVETRIWEQAVDLTLMASEKKENPVPLLCALWDSFVVGYSSPQLAASHLQVDAALNCP